MALPPPRPGMAPQMTHMNNGQIPQGSKLATYMSRQNYGQSPQQQTSLPQQPPQGSAHELANKIANLGLDKKPLQNFAEFVPQNGGNFSSNGGGLPRFGSSNGGATPFFTPRSSNSSTLGPPTPNKLNSASTTPRNSPTPSIASSTNDFSAEQTVAAFSDGGTTYFFNSGEDMQISAASAMAAPVTSGSILVPNFAAYAGSVNSVANMKVRGSTPGFMADNELKMEILKKQHICHSQIDPEVTPNLPTEVDNFHKLCPLEPPPSNPMIKSHTFGYVTSVYKGINMKSGSIVCLRRIHGFRLINTKCMMLVEQWKKLVHSNLVTLRQVFTTKSFGDHSMVFVYDFYPGAETLMTKHFNNPSQISSAFMDPFSADGSRPYSQHKNQILRQQAMLTQNGLLPESLIWTYIIQLTSALRHIHSAGLACRTLDPTKILVINKTRLLLNCGGIFDVLTFDPSNPNPMGAMAHYQQEDLISMGKIVLALACNSFLAIQRENLQTSMEIVTSTYSSDLRNLIMYLLTNPTRVKSVNDLMPMIGARFYTQLDQVYMRTDMLEAELSKDVESARLFRLMTKLCTTVDRAELNQDFGWAEFGDRYMLKLFRDYVFHQVMEDGRPWMDMSHVIACMNKLDAGVPDKVCLMSRDEQNVLVVSYAELKRCMEQSFGEIVQAATQTPRAHVTY